MQHLQKRIYELFYFRPLFLSSVGVMRRSGHVSPSRDKQNDSFGKSQLGMTLRVAKMEPSNRDDHNRVTPRSARDVQPQQQQRPGTTHTDPPK